MGFRATLNFRKFEVALNPIYRIMSGDKYASIFSGQKKANSFPRAMSFEEQIMSKDKYPSIFSPQMEAIVFIILQIFFATQAVLKIGGYLTIRPVALSGYG